MADYFVDSTTGNDGDSGLTMDLAWATMEKAWVSGALNPGDTVWIRRLHSESPTAIVSTALYNGTSEYPIRVIGWPRNSASITSATWTEGSTTVDNIVGLSMDREKHLARYIIAPNGAQLLITKVVDSDTIIIDRPYPGSTQTGTDGAATIPADPDYAEAQAIDDSGWTITVADWTADADDLPHIDFSGGNYYLSYGGEFQQFKNIYWTTGTGYLFYLSGVLLGGFMQGFIIDGSASEAYWRSIGGWVGERFVGDGTASRVIRYCEQFILRDAAFYNYTSAAIVQPDNSWIIENVNFAVEATSPNDLLQAQRGVGTLKDCMYGGTADIFDDTYNMYLPAPTGSKVRFENWQKILGNHMVRSTFGTATKIDVAGGTGDPYKRTNGADSVIEIFNNNQEDNWNWYNPPDYQFGLTPVFEHEFEVNNTPKNYRYYVQGIGAVPSGKLWLECEYIHKHKGATKYSTIKVLSDESISPRLGPDDWSQYIEVTNIQPGVDYGLSKVRIRCHCIFYHASQKIYIDPNPEIT